MEACSQDLKTTCQSCGGAATLICSGCKDAPTPDGCYGMVANTHYCNHLCQQKHWTTHKDLCLRLRRRKILFRAGQLAQEAFYVFRENVFDKHLKRIESNGEDLILHEHLYITDDIVFPFPDNMISDARDKEAILSYLACNDATGYIHKLIGKLLYGEINGVL